MRGSILLAGLWLTSVAVAQTTETDDPASDEAAVDSERRADLAPPVSSAGSEPEAVATESSDEEGVPTNSSDSDSSDTSSASVSTSSDTASDTASDAEPAQQPEDRSWMPYLTAGYRVAIHWGPERGRANTSTTYQGFSISLLAPVLTSGSPDSRHRFALVLGFAGDFAVYDPPNDRDPDDPPYLDVHARRRVSHVAGQLGGTWRAGGSTAFVASLVWLPSRRRTLSGEVDARQRVLARGRLSVGVVSQHLHAAIFVGGEAHDELVWGLAEAQELELGLVFGSGW